MDARLIKTLGSFSKISAALASSSAAFLLGLGFDFLQMKPRHIQGQALHQQPILDQQRPWNDTQLRRTGAETFQRILNQGKIPYELSYNAYRGGKILVNYAISVSIFMHRTQASLRSRNKADLNLQYLR